MTHSMKLIDTNKKGTLILSYYRSGSHFLSNLILEELQKRHIRSVLLHEICNDETVNDLKKVLKDKYAVAIMNVVNPKYDLIASPELLKDWHVIKLTRNNKLQHFISYYFWKKNTLDNQIYKHHNTPSSVYKSNLSDKIFYDINLVKHWLSELLILYFIHSDIELDYKDLEYLATDTVKWLPNDYSEITLSDIFINGHDIEKFLMNFKIS